jgi:N-acetylmuramoyl-L-alanine amidase
VRYPAANQLIASRDSNFIFGTVGSGDATLTINGVPVPVVPNGAFLAYLANPPASAPRYDLVVARGADTVRRSVAVRIQPRPVLAASGLLVVDSSSVTPRGTLSLRDDERVRVAVRAPVNATAWVQLGGGARYPLVSGAELARARFGAVDASSDAGATFSTEIPAGLLTFQPRLIVARARDTVRFTLANVTLPPAEAAARNYGVLGGRTSPSAPAPTLSDTDRVIIGRPIPNGFYKWLLLPGTVVETTGRIGDEVRVRLDDALEVWVGANDVGALPAGYAPPKRVISGARVTPSAQWVDVVLPMAERPAYYVEQNGNALELTLYSTTASPEIIPIAGNDTLVRQLDWLQESSDRLRVTLRLSQRPYGYLAMWDSTRNAFVLRVRRPPVIDASAPLRGRTIVIDPGHPPGGATGPTGLYEPVAVLPVGERVKALLESRGAKVVLTRTTNDALGLTERTVIARRANADAFVSIHLNALPDGVNPFTANGTSTLFFHQMSEPLARPIQRALMTRLGIRDLGVHYQNLAVSRPTWYPSALTEGAFLTIPEQEAAMRDPAYQQRYAEGIVEGLENYFRELGRK